MAKLNGEQIKQLQQAIVGAFGLSDLEQLATIHLPRDLSRLSAGGNRDKIVLDVITKAEEEGWTGELLDAVTAERPKLDDLQKLCAQLGVVVKSPEPPRPAAPPIPTGERRRLEMEYLRAVRDAHDMARLFGLESAPTARQNPRRKLTDVFVPVTLRRFSPPSRREVEHALEGKSGLDALLAWRELSHAEGRSGGAVSLADLLTFSDRLAVVGVRAAARAPSSHIWLRPWRMHDFRTSRPLIVFPQSDPRPSRW